MIFTYDVYIHQAVHAFVRLDHTLSVFLTFWFLCKIVRICTILTLLFILPSLSGGSYHTTSSATNALAENGQDRARVLCSYDARDPSEMSVAQDEVTKFVI